MFTVDIHQKPLTTTVFLQVSRAEAKKAKAAAANAAKKARRQQRAETGEAA